ncbi:MAG: PhnD/SsuA/transferrin family substrate-binding protein [Planctomycetaceae bacterium]|nr:PhnD/SsuA/transferrin family substrate-binding protein [Planctomycetaceae bacterium]
MHKSALLFACSVSLLLGTVTGVQAAEPLTVVVMDPLSAPLSCDCVKGYAQRKYEVLGAYLQRELGQPVNVYWSQSLGKAMQEQTAGTADLIIGKHSVVLFDARAAKLDVAPVAALTGADGKTTQAGLIVVRTDDKAQSVKDLSGYRVFFGPQDCDEKWSAPRALLTAHGVDIGGLKETFAACSEAASALVELDADVAAAAVISSYAEPLLEGCGAVEKGDLRVLGRTEELPFVTAFVNRSLPEEQRTHIQSALLKVGEDADLLIALETESGFVPFAAKPEPDSAQPMAKKK